jgi:multiple sugar transport system ATP-binding protein
MAAIVLRKLRKEYEPPERGLFGARAPAAPAALLGLDLEVKDGELLVLVGPSGCGKSTALRLIAGLEEPSGGSIELGGRDLGGVPPQDRDVAMVFQDYALYPHLTVAKILAFPLEMRGVAREQRDERVREIAQLVGLGHKLDRLPAQLSGGERQRVAMGRAIVRSPKAFLFDEPLSNLDAKLRAELRVEIVQLVKRVGTTAVYVTHDQAEAMTMGDRVAVLRAGELQQIGTPREVYERPANAFVAGFVGTPAMNLVRADGEGVHVAVPSNGHTVGFRPDDVVLGGEGDGLGLDARVRSLEPLGPETIVHLDVGGAGVRARVPCFGGPEIGSELTARVAGAKLHWFDAEGERLS